MTALILCAFCFQIAVAPLAATSLTGGGPNLSVEEGVGSGADFNGTGAHVSLVAGTVITHARSDAPSYIGVPVPRDIASLRLHVISTRPVAVLAARGYFPTEAHYDVANFPNWVHSRAASSLLVPMSELRASPCDAALHADHADDELHGSIDRCLAEMDVGDGLRCGEPVSAVGEVDCRKRVGACDGARGCDPNFGPASCNRNSSGPDANLCLCQRGFCEISSRCVGAELVESNCAKVTGRTCQKFACEARLGPANCEDGLCICQPGRSKHAAASEQKVWMPSGHCSVHGICVPGQMCRELGMRGSCGARTLEAPTGTSPIAAPWPGPWAAAAARVASGSTTSPAPPAAGRAGAMLAKDADCCRLLDTARSLSPGHFARCAARRTFALSAAAERGVRVPIIRMRWPGSLPEGIPARRLGAAGAGADGGVDGTVEDLDDLLVVALRAAPPPPAGLVPAAPAAPVAAAAEPPSQASQDSESVPVRLSVELAAPGDGPGEEAFERFYTFQELISPAFAKSSLPVVRLLEPPATSTGPLSARSRLTGGQGLRLGLRAGELTVLRLPDDAVEAAAAALRGRPPPPTSQKPARGTAVALSARGLPPGSQVLYGRSWPEPRSLMDFGYARPLAAADVLVVPTGLDSDFDSAGAISEAWTAEDVDSCFFAVMPSTDAEVSFSFFVLVAPSPSEEPGELAARPVVLAGSDAPAGPPSALPPASVLFASVVMLLAVASGRSCRRRRRSGITAATPRYLPVALSEPAHGAVTGGSACASVQVGAGLGGVARAAALAAHALKSSDLDLAFGSITRRLLSVSTRAGTSRSGGTRRSTADDEGAEPSYYGDCDESEAKSLLHGGDADSDEEATHAVDPAPSSRKRSFFGFAGPSLKRKEQDEDDEEDDPSGGLGALLKLRPAAHDSIGDDCEELGVGAGGVGPLVGTERAGLLHR